MLLELIVAVIIIVGMFALLIPFAILDGWVFAKLWAWFMIPAFGFAPLPIALAIGLSFLIHYMFHQLQLDPPMDKEAQKEYSIKKLAAGIARPLVVLLFGWIVSWFIPENMQPLNQPTISIEAANKAVLHSLATDLADRIVEAE